MRATVQTDALLEVLGNVKSAVPSQATLPICKMVLLRAGQGKLSVTANNLEACLTGQCEAKVVNAGAVCLPPKALEAFLKAAGAERVTISLAGKGRPKIEAGAATTTLDGAEAEDFPPIPKVKGEVVEIRGLAKALREVAYAMASEASRPVLNGVCFTPGNGKVELAACDGFRLAITAVKAKGKLPGQVIIPASAIKLLTKLMPGKVTMQQGKAITFEANGLAMAVRPIDGTYPNYQQLVPRNGAALKADVGELKKALKVVTVIRPDGAVRLQTKGKTLVVSVNADESDAEVKVAAQGKAKTAFEARYLKDLLDRIEGTLVLRTTGPTSPGVVKHNGTTHVLMPLFVQW